MSSEVLILIGTLGGAAIGALASLLTTWITKRSEERRHYKQLVINAAIENWKQLAEIAKEKGARLYPLDSFIFQMVKFSEMILDKKLSASELEKAFNEYDDIVDKVAVYKKQRKHAWRDEDA